jgi:hypothetical protein
VCERGREKREREKREREEEEAHTVQVFCQSRQPFWCDGVMSTALVRLVDTRCKVARPPAMLEQTVRLSHARRPSATDAYVVSCH